MRRVAKIAGLTLLVALVIMQFVPYGHDHDNPRVTQDAPWPSARAEAIARESCYDCHSNETKWRWYTNVAPMSFLAVNDVKEGRHEVNFSEWDRPQEEADDLQRVIRRGSMPPRQYTLLHPDASLDAQERQVLLDALRQLPGAEDDPDDDD